jgi:hypothetical protein
MSEALSFRLSPKTSWDEDIKEQSILRLIWATAPRTSVGVTATNEAKSHRPGLVKLTAGGFSDRVRLSRAQTRDKRFDVSLASALHNFVVAPARCASQGSHRRLRKKRSGSTGEKHRKSKQAYLGENVIAAILNSQGARLATPSIDNSTKNIRSMNMNTLWRFAASATKPIPPNPGNCPSDRARLGPTTSPAVHRPLGRFLQRGETTATQDDFEKLARWHLRVVEKCRK